jgi:putative transposase
MINQNNKRVSIRRQSELLNVNRSMLYYSSSEDTENFILSNKIAEIYSKYPIYGYRRITAILNREGVSVNHKRVQRLMNEMNLHAIYPRPNTSKKDKKDGVFPYLLNNLLINRVHQAWQVDITYLRTKQGFMYLVALIDVYSRMIVGFRLSNSLCTDSCKSALDDAICKYGAPQIINSDQGSQFTSESWVKKLSYHKIKISMTGKGRCIDNVYIERLWRAFKYEGSYLYQWNTVDALKANIPLWVNWYNWERPHQSLDYQTPAEVENLQLAQMKKDNVNFHLLNDNFNSIKEVNMT